MDRGSRGTLFGHLLLLLAVSATYESLFVHRGLNRFDEGWPLYAAMRLHAGGTLYDDVFFVFPPGHLLSAWVAYALDPPGVVLARIFYAGFDVALVLALYLLGRRLVPPAAALGGALLLAIAAPHSHLAHLLFGYRYLVFSVLALLFFAQRLASGNPRWLVAAGAAAGAALCFRLTPAFAVACGVAVGIATSHRSPRRWAADALLFGAGAAVVVVPMLVWLAAGAGLDDAWREAVVRPVEMTRVQDLDHPPLALPDGWDRKAFRDAFNALQYRLWALLYVGFAAVLVVRYARSLRAGRPFEDALLAAVVTWGGVYWMRTLGRTDLPHLESALPPVCLLLAVLAHACAARAGPRRTAVAAGIWTFLFAVWIYFPGPDRMLDPEFAGKFPVQSLDREVRARFSSATNADFSVASILQAAQPSDTVLDLTASPLHVVLSGRMGPGGPDVVIPGTFRDETEERALLERLRRAPPAVVLWTDKPFDRRPERAVEMTAPLVAEWVRENYESGPPRDHLRAMVPRDAIR